MKNIGNLKLKLLEKSKKIKAIVMEKGAMSVIKIDIK